MESPSRVLPPNVATHVATSIALDSVTPLDSRSSSPTQYCLGALYFILWVLVQKFEGESSLGRGGWHLVVVT